MTEAQHKPKEWQIEMSIIGPSKSKLEINGVIGTEAKDAILKALHLDFQDARRIEACLNACEGLPTDVLENITTMGDTLASRFKARDKTERELTAQRDELLKVLRELADSFDPQTKFSELEKARTVIAKVNGLAA